MRGLLSFSLVKLLFFVIYCLIVCFFSSTRNSEIKLYAALSCAIVARKSFMRHAAIIAGFITTCSKAYNYCSVLHAKMHAIIER